MLKTPFSIRILILAGMLGILGSSLALADPDGRTLLQKAIQNEPKARYQGVYVTQIKRGETSRIAKSVVKRNGSQGFRMEFTAPVRMKGARMVDDGVHFLEQLPGNRPARYGRSRARLPLLILFPSHLVTAKSQPKGLSIKTLGKEKAAGRDAWLVEIAMGRSESPRRHLWIDAERWIPLRSEVLDSSGKVLFRSYFERIDFKPDFDTQDFKVKAPTQEIAIDPMSLSSVREKAPFSVMEPGWLPEGFRLEGAALMNWSAQSSVVRMRYSDGYAAFTIFESRNARLPKALPKRMLSKSVRGVNVTLISSNLHPAKAKRVFESIH